PCRGFPNRAACLARPAWDPRQPSHDGGRLEHRSVPGKGRIMTITAPVSDKTRSFAGRAKKLLIGGAWVDSASGAAFATVDPATELEICEVARGSEEDVNRAVAPARRAFTDGPWAT